MVGIIINLNYNQLFSKASSSAGKNLFTTKMMYYNTGTTFNLEHFTPAKNFFLELGTEIWSLLR